MIAWLKHRFSYMMNSNMPLNRKQKEQKPANPELLYPSLLDNNITIRQKFSNSSDLLINEFVVAGHRVSLVMCEAMINTQTMTEILLEPMMSLQLPPESPPEALLDWIRNDAVLSSDQSEIRTFDEVFQFIMSGFVVVLIDGLQIGTSLGMQGFAYRSVSEPSTEVNERGSREGFVEPIRINLSMIRRRIKSPTMKFELSQIGTKSKTDICLVYLTDMVSKRLLEQVRHRLAQVKLDVLLESGYLQPYLETGPVSIFSSVGVTERPDTLCGKIREGRIAVLVDGTPFALIVPYLFSENFQSLDDYCHRPYFTSFIRILKYLSFFFTILLPGLYVAVANFHPEMFPRALLFNVAAAEQSTPLPLVFEALIIFLIYEIMREAGLRLPRPVGHAVSIVGALVIGDAAVTAGLIGAPMVMVVALTAISSFVVPSIYEPVTLLRFTFILVGGTMGLYGIALVLCVVGINLCTLTSFGIPYTAPITPFNMRDMRDVFIRTSWRSMSDYTPKIQDMPGSAYGDESGE